MSTTQKKLSGALAAAGLSLPLLAIGNAAFAASPVGRALVLQNGWTSAPYATSNASASVAGGIVSFTGAISTSGTDARPFTLPAGYRPATDVYVQVDLCNAAKGRLHITPDGAVEVQTETAFSDAQCFTSLDGVSFAINDRGFTALTLQNGWTNGPYATSNAAAKKDGAVVRLKGAIASGTTSTAFRLPAGMRPAQDVYIPVDQCNATKGRLHIVPTGQVTVQAEGSYSNAQCFTSLDGVAFKLASAADQTLGLKHGWTSYFSGVPKVASANGVVRFSGAIGSGTTDSAFTLPAALRPATTVYVAVDQCNAHNGRLRIEPTGAVYVQAKGDYVEAQCFTSLDGASFDLGGFAPIALAGDWLPYNDNPPAAANISGIVTLRGAIKTAGTGALAFTLPENLRPATNVWVTVDLCNANKGRLAITPNGEVSVQAKDDDFGQAQCFTSLDGVSFAAKPTGFTALALENGWTNGAYGASDAAVKTIAGIVHFKGAISNGTSAGLFTLPEAFRPAATVYAPVDLCNAKKGRLAVSPSGTVTVQAESGDLADATCFTSLDGVTFALGSLTPLAPKNGWTDQPYATGTAGASNVDGVVRFQGAISTAGGNPVALKLPAGLRPAVDTWVHVDLCNATSGRLYIQPDGTVTVQAQGDFSTATCFTSLDGASFAQ